LGIYDRHNTTLIFSPSGQFIASFIFFRIIYKGTNSSSGFGLFFPFSSKYIYCILFTDFVCLDLVKKPGSDEANLGSYAPLSDNFFFFFLSEMSNRE